MHSDLMLVQAIARGERAAMDVLYQRYGLQLLNYLIGQVGHRQQAEDVLQTVMLAVWNTAGRFRAESSVRTWLFAIARNQALNVRRQDKNHAQLADDHIASTPHPDLAVERSMEVEALASAMRDLPFEQQQALELFFYKGLSLAEGAKKVGVPLNTFKSRLHRAKQALRERLMEEEIENG